MRSPIAMCFLLVLAASLLGCATTGHPYDDAAIASIEKGVTTEAQLLQEFGPATSRSMSPDGRKTLRWKFTHRKTRTTSSSGSLDVKLDTDGKVSAYFASGNQ